MSSFRLSCKSEEEYLWEASLEPMKKYF